MNTFCKIIIAVCLFACHTHASAQTPVSYFGAIPDLKVSGKEFVDPTGKAVTLHGVMDTPNAYFNGNRWTNGIAYPYYNQPGAVAAVKKYFTKIFQAIANPTKGTYCNLFRLHLDPAWLRDDNITADGFTVISDKDKTAKDPHGNEVGDEANIIHFSMDKFKARMTDLYVPIIQDALAHGLYVVVRPPGVFPHDIWVGDYYNTFLTNIWDEISKNDYIKAHSGQIMLELGNEPVRIWKTGQTIPTVPATNKTLESTRGDAYNGHSENNPVLADFFQPIVDKIRQNGFNGIILLPGTSYQANYNSYKNKAISDNNYGYAVHNYPGWYGGWDANQTEAQFISTFESQVPVDSKPIVITEVDWSPEWRLSDKSHWNEEHTQFTAGNYGTWATGTTNGVTQGVDLVASQNIGWGLKYRHLVDKHPNISFTLQGTTTYVDMDAYLKDATVQPAFLTQMKKDGYPDARQACSGYCFDWYKDFACGERIPYGTPSVAPEIIEYHSAISGNARYDESNQHYIFPTTYSCAFIVNRYEGVKLSEAGKLLIKLGEGTVGYRLDVQLKNGNEIIKDGTNDYIIGSEGKNTRYSSFVDAKYVEYDLPAIFADYLSQYPDCTIGGIRINTATPKDSPTDYWFTISDMILDKGTLSARTPAPYEETNLADVKMYRHESTKNVVVDDDAETARMGGWGGTITRTAGAGKDGSYCYELTNEQTETWKAQVAYSGTYPNGTEYTLSMDIRGASSGSLPINFQKSEGYVGCGSTTVNYTTEWQTVTVPIKVTGEGADRLLFDYGGKSTLYIDNVQLYTGSEKVTEITGPNIKLGEQLTEKEVFGAGLLGNVTWNEYADLSSYSKMIIKGTGGSLRVLYNRPAAGACPELNPTLASGEAVVDLTAYPFFHLNSIKAGNGQTVNVSSITLIDGSGNNVDIADYYISGAGHEDSSVAQALADEHATVIDVTGYTGSIEYPLRSANPNCLLIYREGSNVGSVYGDRNMVKSTDNSSYKIDLVDGYDFRAPFNISTYLHAQYTRDLASNNWGTIALPFALDVTVADSPLIFQLTSSDSDNLVFKQVTSETLPAGSVILYYKENGGETVLKGSNIAKTAEGFNVQPVEDMEGWYTAQNFKQLVIDDVATDPVLKDYDVYAIQKNNFVHATKKLTLKPFRAIFLHKKGSGAAKANYGISIYKDDATGVNTADSEIPTEHSRYDLTGRRIQTATKGVNIVRYSNGNVKRILVK